MKPCQQSRLVILLLILLLTGVLGFISCGRSRGRRDEVAYIAAPQAVLRDRLAAVYTKTGVVKNGEQVQVLERERRFVRVRAADGSEGWMEQRHLATQLVYARAQKLAQEEQDAPVQASGTTRNDTNIHLDFRRDADHLYVLNQGAKVSVLKRATSQKVLPVAGAKPAADRGQPVPPVLEDWWLIRDAPGHAGWVLARMVDLDLPLEIAQYAEGQRIVAFFVLDDVADGDRKVSQYLVLFTEPKDGLPFDYNQVRVFTWNVKRHRYETAYRERNLNGVLPAAVSQESFDKEGMLPVFTLHVKDDDGNLKERKYKLNTPIVRRVLAPGEQVSVGGRRSPRKGANRKEQGR